MSVEKIPHFVFASAMAAYPGLQDLEVVQGFLEDWGDELPRGLRDVVARATRDPEEMLTLESEYINLFERGRSRNPLYETEYGRDRAMAKGTELADIAGFYKAFGFEISENEELREMVDHVAVELEFYALLLMKEEHLRENRDENGAGIVQVARGKFLKDHLGRFVGALAERPAVLDSTFYGGVFGWCRDLIDEECRALGVTPDKATWAASTPPPLKCGGDACGN